MFSKEDVIEDPCTDEAGPQVIKAEKYSATPFIEVGSCPEI